jgi:hypothetical protein
VWTTTALLDGRFRGIWLFVSDTHGSSQCVEGGQHDNAVCDDSVLTTKTRSGGDMTREAARESRLGTTIHKPPPRRRDSGHG